MQIIKCAAKLIDSHPRISYQNLEIHVKIASCTQG
jgi:hypothetical protein